MPIGDSRSKVGEEFHILVLDQLRAFCWEALGLARASVIADATHFSTEPRASLHLAPVWKAKCRMRGTGRWREKQHN